MASATRTGGRHHLRNRHELVAFGFVVRDEAGGGVERCLAVGAHTGLVSVIEEDDVATSNLALGVGEDLLAGGGPPIVTSDAPHDGLEAQLAKRVEGAGAAASVGRTAQGGHRAAGVEDGGLCAL